VVGTEGNERALKVTPVISFPRRFMGEEPADTGYWGFVRSRKDYDREKQTVLTELGELVKQLNDEGHRICLLPEIETAVDIDSVMAAHDAVQDADVALNLTFGSLGNLGYPLLDGPRYLIFFEKYKPNIYSGTLFSPPSYQEIKRRGLARRVFIVEGDFGKLAKILRALSALKMIATSKPVCIGPINSAFGGWLSLAIGEEKFGYSSPRFYSYDRFATDFREAWDSRRNDAKTVADNFVSNATRVVEPDEENLLRAATYHLVIEDYLEENQSDWIMVNCLSKLIAQVKATPCMSFALLNDEGKVGTCEADPTAGPMHYLMRHISGRPAFFNDPTVNEKDGTIILAHCTSPTRLLGADKPGFPYEVRTHHESNTGATVKPVYEQGTVTVAGLSFDYDRMLIVKGEVVGTPNLRICRSQVEVKVRDSTDVLEDWQGFHWVMVYGDYVDELRFVCQAVGIEPVVHA